LREHTPAALQQRDVERATKEGPVFVTLGRDAAKIKVNAGAPWR
jgi:hypothetical protein